MINYNPGMKRHMKYNENGRVFDHSSTPNFQSLVNIGTYSTMDWEGACALGHANN